VESCRNPNDLPGKDQGKNSSVMNFSGKPVPWQLNPSLEWYEYVSRTPHNEPRETLMPDSLSALHTIDTLTRRSVLRYPGGKSRALKTLLTYFPADIGSLCSPFLGGGSVELACAARGIRVSAYDIFTPLAEFWQIVQIQPEALAGEVRKYFPLSKEQFYALQSEQEEFSTALERAAAFYVLNRASYSGSTLSGGMSPGHPRFTESSIRRLAQFHNPNLTVKRMDFQKSIPLHQHDFLYLDPPYLIESNLYGKNGDAHRDFDHEALFKLLEQRHKWVLSYNNCDAIGRMYKNYAILQPQWKYGMSNNKNSREVLILSHDVAEYFGYPPGS